MYPVTIIIPLILRSEEEFGYAVEAVESALNNNCYVSMWDDTTIPHSEEDVHLIEQRRIFYKLYSNINNVILSGDGVNRGVSYARNKAVYQARDGLILPLDSDDVLAPTAVKELCNAYRGTPLYPDVKKFGSEEVAHYRLLDFSCDHLHKKVGIASVCVLHEKKHWKRIGGWREDLDFYEDGEYNARLFGEYCGANYHKPLYHYRQRVEQKTRIRHKEAALQARTVLQIIKGNGIMACCGRGRKNVNTDSKGAHKMVMNVAKDVGELALTQGDRVLAQYLGGKGKGKHYKRGATGYNYKVEYGHYYYVFHEDARLPQEDPGKSLFVRVVRDEPDTTDDRKPVVSDDKNPILEYVVEETDDEEDEEEEFLEDEEYEEIDLVDIINMSWNDLRHMDFSPAEAAALLELERNGKNRVKFVAKLERAANG